MKVGAHAGKDGAEACPNCVGELGDKDSNLDKQSQNLLSCR